MIQPNEKLLPGNVVMFHGEIDSPRKLTYHNVYTISNSTAYASAFSPIPLTPEVLTDWAYWKKMPGVDQWNFGYRLWIKKECNDDIWIIIFKGKIVRTICYLHELQNTAYFIAGQEMEVSLPK